MSDKAKVRVDDTTTVNMNVKGDGSDVTPFVLEADVIISPASNNKLKDDGNGLFVENNTYPITIVTQTFSDITTGGKVTVTEPLPVEKTKLFVYIGGVKQVEGEDFILVGQDIHFTLSEEDFPIASGHVEIYKFAPFEVTQELFNNLISGNSVTIVKDLPTDTSLIQVYANGLKQVETVDYNVNGQQLEFVVDFDTQPINRLEVLVFTNK